MGFGPGYLLGLVVAVLPVGLHKMGAGFEEWKLERVAVVTATEIGVELAVVSPAGHKDSDHRAAVHQTVAVDDIGRVAVVAVQMSVAAGQGY